MAETQARVEIKQQLNEIRRLKEELAKVRTDKNDFEQICQNLNDKIRQYVNREQRLEKAVQQKDDLIHKQRGELEEQEMVIQGQATDLKKCQLRLRQINTTKVKDMQKRVKEKDQVIDDLNQKLQKMAIQNAQLMYQQHSVTTDGAKTTERNSLSKKKIKQRRLTIQNSNLQSQPVLNNPISEEDQEESRINQYMSIDDTTPQMKRKEPQLLPRSETQLGRLQSRQALPAIKSSLNNPHHSSSMHHLSSQHPVQQKFNQQFQAYEMKFNNPSFKNQSSGVGSSLSSNKFHSPSKVQQFEIIEQKLSKISHLF